tara:strand:- start:1360 stop:2046 length:687 start_codon:yes stop_codon:yes gene_type:complete
MKTSQTHTYKNTNKLRYHQKILLDIIKKDFKNKIHGKILDIGCANGIFIKKLSNEFKKFECTGIDTSSNMIFLAKKNKSKNLSFYKKDFMKYNKKLYFDIVIASGVLAFYDNFSKVLDKMTSFLKKNSHLYIFGTFNSHDIDTIVKFRNNYTKSDWEKGLNSFSIKRVSDYLTKKKYKFSFKKFNIPFNLKKKANPILSYTLSYSKDKRIILNGANIKMELFYLRIKK